MDDILNPISPRNPTQQILADPAKVSSTSKDAVEDNYIEGAENVYLPSKGVFYGFDQKYWNIESLKVRRLDYTDEDILTTRSFLDNGTIFHELLKNVIVDENKFPASRLSPIDRDTILLWLRSTSFGNDFEIELKCPDKDCQKPIKVKWDLSKLSIPEYREDIYEELKANGELLIETPIRKALVRIIVPSVGESIETEKRMMQKKKDRNESKDSYGTGSLMLIVSGIDVDGKTIRNKNEIQNYFNKIHLPIPDSRYIRRRVEDINLTYETKQNVTCNHCGHVEEGVEMPIMHPNFLWNIES